MDLDPRLRPDHGAAQRLNSSSSSSAPPSQLDRTNPSGLTPTSHGIENNPQHHSPSLEGQDAVSDQDGAGAAGADAKKSRACESCRGLKVRCEPDLIDESAPCKRCKKAGRNCVVTMPTRKRHKKTNSRVSELEKKIDALTASLQARTGAPVSGFTSGHGAAAPSMAQQKQSPEEFLGPWANPEPGRYLEPIPAQRSQASPSYRTSIFDPKDATTGQKRKAGPAYRDGSGEDSRLPPLALSQPYRSDVVDRGLISLEQATDLLSRYTDHMMPHLPAVVIPAHVPVTELRRSQPYLFLAIMAAAASATPGLQRVLQRELVELFAEKVIVVGEKSLELVQALHIAVIWYWAPDRFEELKFYQLVHMAAVMALDIGLGKKSKPKRGLSGFIFRQGSSMRRAQPLDPTSIESRRTWLTCHYLAANTAMALRRPHLIRWSPFMTECLEVLSTSPDACPTDKYFCHLAWTHRMAEDIGVQLSTEDDSAVQLSDSRTQYSLRGLERDLAKYRASVPEEMLQPGLKISFDILNLYMHELALHTEGGNEQLKPPFITDILPEGMVAKGALSAAHINALSSCISAITSLFRTFLDLDVFAIRCLPVFNFVRVAYAVVVLIKLFFAASSPSSELGQVIDRDNMRVQYYLEALLDKFRACAADDKCRPASKFLLVLVMLRSWFVKMGKVDPKQNDNDNNTTTTTTTTTPRQATVPASDSSTATPAPSTASSNPLSAMQPLPPTPSHDHAANTPLQVLSEVAMGRESTTLRPLYAGSVVGANSAPPPPAFYQHTAPANTPSTATPSSGTAYPPLWTDQQQQQQQQQQPQQQQPAMLDWNFNALDYPPGLDFENLGVPIGDALDGGAMMVFNDPLFGDVFQHLPDPNSFM